MAVVQDSFFIPEDIAIGLVTGLYQRNGSVIRYAEGLRKGQIVKHLDPANLKTEQVKSFIVKGFSLAQQHKKGAIIAVASVMVLGMGAVVMKTREPEVLTKFRESFRIYIDAIRTGNMDINKINNLMDCLEILREHKDYAKINIRLTAEDLRVLVGHIYNYTIKLARDNNVELSDKELNSSDKGNGDTIIALENYLKIQKRIFSEVA